jgi:hypothetical protein
MFLRHDPPNPSASNATPIANCRSNCCFTGLSPRKVAGRIVLLGSLVEPKLTVLPFCAARKRTSAGEGVRTFHIAEQWLWRSAEAWSIVLRARKMAWNGTQKRISAPQSASTAIIAESICRFISLWKMRAVHDALVRDHNIWTRLNRMAGNCLRRKHA